MNETDLDRRFNEAFELASNMTETLPPDVMLRIYAYFKQATHGTVGGSQMMNSSDLRNAFKTNAWMQISHLTPDEAKELYIETIHSLIKKK
jgi:acyl-CoA-binding protein